MGFGAVAGHLVIFLAVFSAGILMAGAINNGMSAQIEARDEFTDRMAAKLNAGYSLASDGYSSGLDRTYANFTNDGSREVSLEGVTLLVDGQQRDPDQVQTFRIRDGGGTDLWMPGEVLEIRTEDRGNVDITITGPHGVASHRRN